MSNVELESMVHGYDASQSGPFGPWVDQVTHIHERPFADPGDRTSDLGLVAARQALAEAGIAPTDVGMIVYASFTSSQLLPGDCCRLGSDLGAKGAGVFVLTAACAGSTYGLGVAFGLVASRLYRHVLVVATETITPFVNWHDPLTAILFGDGAGAAVVSWVDDPEPGTGMLPPQLAFDYNPTLIHLGNSNNPHDDLRTYPPAPDRPSHPLVERSLIVMNGGPSVLRSAINAMAECVVKTLGYDREALKAKDPQLMATLASSRLIPHQANGRIVDGLADRLGVPLDRTIRTIYRYGNMSAASNLVALDFALRHGTMDRVLDAEGRVLDVVTTPEGRIRKGELVLMPSIGGGYLMGSVGFVQSY